MAYRIGTRGAYVGGKASLSLRRASASRLATLDRRDAGAAHAAGAAVRRRLIFRARAKATLSLHSGQRSTCAVMSETCPGESSPSTYGSSMRVGAAHSLDVSLK